MVEGGAGAKLLKTWQKRGSLLQNLTENSVVEKQRQAGKEALLTTAAYPAVQRCNAPSCILSQSVFGSRGFSDRMTH